MADFRCRTEDKEVVALQKRLPGFGINEPPFPAFDPHHLSSRHDENYGQILKQ